MDDDAEGHPLKGLRLKWRRTEAGSVGIDSAPSYGPELSGGICSCYPFRVQMDINISVHQTQG